METYICLILVACMSVLASGEESPCEKSSCGILLDCGSSGTRIKIYSWENTDSVSNVPKITQYFFDGVAKYYPGLADFEGDVDGMRSYMKDIIDEAKKHIPASAQGSTPIFAMATAGFRLLGIEDAKKGMDELNTILLDKSFNPFKFEEGQASVISGEEEGVYSWLAANYLNGFFNSEQPDEKDAVGIMEMGGGSTQIAFIPSDPLMSEEFMVIVGGKPYSLYVQSYLKFGTDAIQIKVAEQLNETSCTEKILNPCLLKGDVRNVTLENGKDVEAYGTGDADSCNEVFKVLLASAPPKYCNLPPCAIGSVFQPSVEGIDFYATSGYQYPAEAIGVTNPVLDLPDFWQKTKIYCLTNFNDLPEDDDYAYQECLRAVQMYAIFTGPYGFPLDTTHITIANDQTGGDIDWALGAMLEYLSTHFTDDTSACSTTGGRSKRMKRRAFHRH